MISDTTADDDDLPALPCPTGEALEDPEVNISCLGDVTWSSNSGPQHINGLTLNIYIDRMSNTALFKLSCSIYFKYGKAREKKQRVFLFIYPESIQSIRLGLNVPTSTSPTLPTLTFSMSKKPAFITPRNCILISKPKTKDLLKSICALANATALTICLNVLRLPIVIQHQLEHIVNICSATNIHNRPRTNARRSNLKLLYAGRGGEVVGETSAASVPTGIRSLLRSDTRPLFKIISK